MGYIGDICGNCDHRDTNVNFHDICTKHNFIIRDIYYSCKDYATYTPYSKKEFTEICANCRQDTSYNYKDIPSNFMITCSICSKLIISCDFCNKHATYFCDKEKCLRNLNEARNNYGDELEKEKNIEC